MCKDGFAPAHGHTLVHVYILQLSLNLGSKPESTGYPQQKVNFGSEMHNQCCADHFYEHV